MSAYCQISDLYDYGLPRGGLPNPARLIDSVSVATDTFVLNEHGFEGGEQITFRADTDAGGTLPAPLVEGVKYFALKVSTSLFQVSTTLGGPAINLSSTGYLVLVGEELPLLKSIQWASAILEDLLPAHLVPLPEPYPEIVRMTAAELAVGRLMTRQGATPESMGNAVTAAQERLKRWSKGIPVRGTAPATRANLAASASVAYRDSRGWNTPGVI